MSFTRAQAMPAPGLLPDDGVPASNRCENRGAESTLRVMTMKCRFLLLACVCGLSVACLLPRGPSAENVFPIQTLQGDWGWTGLDECTKGPIRFRFTDASRRMHLSHLTEAPDGSKQLPRVETSYTVLGGSPDRLHLRMDGDEKGEDGQPVTWDLVLFNENTYRWHRSDWPPGGHTKAVRRCGQSPHA